MILELKAVRDYGTNGKKARFTFGRKDSAVSGGVYVDKNELDKLTTLTINFDTPMESEEPDEEVYEED